jgi:hypothetical protein
MDAYRDPKCAGGNYPSGNYQDEVTACHIRWSGF